MIAVAMESGVKFEKDAHLNCHIDHVIKKVQSKLCILRKFRRHIAERTALRLYKTLIMCHMDYGDFLLDSGYYGYMMDFHVTINVSRNINFMCK